MLHTNFITHIEQLCSQIEKKEVNLRAYEKVYGGDLNQTYRLAMTDKDYFIKVNTYDKLEIFEKEALSLQVLSNTKSFVIPNVYQVSTFENQSFLLMQYIEKLEQTSNPKKFAESLAKMHSYTQDYYGFDTNNFIGTLPQINTFSDNWIDFYIKNRLQYQIDINADLLPIDIRVNFEKLFKKLPELLSVDKPTLLHGDLWTGNYFYDLQGNAVVFDPAVYYGHREIDLAMMSLFGGFEIEIYQIYNQLLPMEPNWKERLKIYQLYPLLVHFNLFGENYLSGIKQILKTFI